MTKILAVLSRDYSKVSNVGRKETVMRWLAALRPQFALVEFVPAMAQNMGLATFATALVRRAVFGGAPLQSALYDMESNVQGLVDAINSSRPDVLFVEGGRQVPYVRRALARLGNASPICKIIVDIDDLMSRRYRLYQRYGIGLDVGILGSKLGVYTRHLGNSAGNALLSLEAGRMMRLEAEILDFADDVIVSNEFEGKILARIAGPHKARLHRQIIGYTVDPIGHEPVEGRLVFGFVGSDKLKQNHFSIRELIRIWKQYEIPHELRIIGRMHQTYEAAENVVFTGFVDDLDDCYRSLDALLIFSYIPGGLKTKIPEGMSKGLPVIVNSIAVEGLIGFADYGLFFEEPELIRFLHGDMSAAREFLESYRGTCLDMAKKYWSFECLKSFTAEVFRV